MKLVNSRTFSSSPLPIFNPIPPLTLTGLSVLSYFLGVTTINQIADASGLILCYIIFQDFILPKFGDKKVHKILPGIDYINHSNEPNSEVKLNYFTGNHEVVTTKEIGKGEEITISYGKKSNDQVRRDVTENEDYKRTRKRGEMRSTTRIYRLSSHSISNTPCYKVIGVLQFLHSQ